MTHRDPDQKMRFNKAELGQIKALFADNEELLFAIRKVLLQFPLSEKEQALVKQTVNESSFALIKKFFLPVLDADAPLFQMTDMYLGLQADLARGVDDAWPYILAKELEMAYIGQQLRVLRDVTAEWKQKIQFDELIKVSTKTRREESWVGIVAHNYILSFVDSNIQQIKLLAGIKEETVEETLERLKQDSAK